MAGDSAIIPDEFGGVQVLLDHPKKFQAKFLHLLNNAQHSIRISTFRFENPLNKKNSVIDAIFYALQLARKRKVKVEVLLNYFDPKIKLGQENGKTARELQRFGCYVRRPQGNACNHAKILIVDDRYFIMGSHNISRQSLGHNFEVSMYFEGYPILTELLKAFTDAWDTAAPF